MARSRTTKQIAKRITLDYFKRPNKIRRASRILTVVLCVGSLLYVFGMTRRSQDIFNPGPVSVAHGHFENDCLACHVGSSPGGSGKDFYLPVSDAACLKCHDGPVHHKNQATLVSTHTFGDQISSNCVRCHVEHRGHEALAGLGIRHCTMCHDDLDPHSKDKGAVQVDKQITAFAIDNHPEFGRKLRKDASGPGLHDPTPLAFNHAKHMELFKEMESIQNCYGCHTSSVLNPNAKLPGPEDTPTTSKSPPWRTPTDVNPLWLKDRQSLAWTVSADHEYIGPVNYERACIECHRMEIVPGIPIPHESMDTVRATLAQYSLQVVQSQQKFVTQLEEELKKNPNFLTTEKVITRPIRKVVKETKTREQWLDEQMKPVLGNVAKWFEQDAPTKPGWPEKFKGAPVTQLLTNPEALQFYAAYSLNGCVKCHELTGNAGGTTAPADGLVKLTTSPTGIGDTPRRWFTNSQFSHDAHRAQSCLDCHHGAKESKLTSDVLMPGIKDCTSCHHAPKGTDRGVRDACVTCHVYHDRTLERKPILPGKSIATANPATQPAPQ